MNFTTRMATLLSAMRRERNGAVADAMRYYGAAYGLNYGTSLPTLRRIARAEAQDHDFARYLYLQDVRELRLAALHIAEPARLSPAEADAWAAGIINSEVAEEMAFALMSRSDALEELFGMWSVSENPLLVYTALLAAARNPLADVEHAEAALTALHRFAVAELLATENTATVHTAGNRAANVSARSASLSARDASHLVAQATIALLAAVGANNEKSRRAVLRMADSPGKLPAEDCVHEELSWRLET